MNRREFLKTAKVLGVAGAVGVPLLSEWVVKGDLVDVTFKSESVVLFHDFRLFVDRAGGTLGVLDEPGKPLRRATRMQIPLGSALRALRLGTLETVRLETVSGDGSRGFGDPAVLFSDSRADEFGVCPPDGRLERITVPLSSVVRLLKKAEVLA